MGPSAEQSEKTWQQTKSENTRTAVLEAAVDCFYELGYANTTTDKISRRAGVSRGAMLHHFPTRFDLIKAAVEYLNEQRLATFAEEESRIHLGADNSRIEEGIDAYWRQLNTPVFVVFHELKVAARTDKELEKVLTPVLKDFDRAWYEAVTQIFPDLALSDAFARTNYLTQYLLEGMAAAKMIDGPKVPEKKMLAWLKRELRRSYQDVLGTVKRPDASTGGLKMTTKLLQEQSLADPDVQERPIPYYHALHERPIYFDERLGFYICSKYRPMREILRNTEVFSSVDSQTVDGLRPPPPEVLELRKSMHPTVNTLVTNDPPSHTRIRAMVNEPFRPRSIEHLRGQIRDIVNETIDAFIDDGKCEAVSQLAIPIPIKVIADMLGIPRSMAPSIKAWSDASVEPLGMMVSDERLIECVGLIKEFQGYITAELEARKSNPREDLLTHLVEARDADGAAFTMAEMLSLTQQFLVAGNETTTNGIAAGMQLLIDNPDQQAILRGEQDENRTRVFANEVLRLESPAAGLFRVVKQDTELEGVKIPAGARIMLRFAAANRDPDKYDHPDALDVTRHNAGTHLGFGAGIHHCIGANLAREELVHTFDILLSRAENFAYQEGQNDFTHHPSLILRGLKRLYVTFDKRS